ncbi:hypothetical protein DL240_12085 [Lujinxingia litoralis]|uniref:Uncharacterized protein n=1 Tax=Lujinxingia litoralis TaxID=2211119 RepID=A0A328C4D0_9DELT|nr:hypothetical protein [Lujinxingia litoralis]RAL21589.1 hypothetical protein DL240_12085 [Lujinxingia litoralis]
MGTPRTSSLALAALILTSALLLLAGCSFESAQLASVRCEQEGEVRDDQRCTEGYWVKTDDLLDLGLGDTADTPDVCVPESDSALCADHGAVCGPLSVTDRCGEPRNVECGSCPGESYEREVGDPYPCCEGNQTCMCQDVERFGPGCEDGTCKEIFLGQETRTSGCAPCAAECDSWGECSWSSTCALTGERTRSCTGQACQAGACVDADAPFNETEACPRDTDTLSCAVPDACSTGTCGAGECQSSPRCEGTTESCGCESCEDCSLRDGWYNRGTAEPCCGTGSTASSCLCQTREYREYSCDGTACTYEVTNTDVIQSNCTTCQPKSCVDYSPCETGSTCGTQGTRTRTCQREICEPTTGECTARINVEEHSCVVDTAGRSCDLNDTDSCIMGVCSEGSCISVPVCEGTNASCGCATCEDCTQRADEWIVDEDSLADCCHEGGVCQCGQEVLHTWRCGDTGCERYPTATVRDAQTSCTHCQHGCIEPGGSPCCRRTGSDHDTSCQQ